jgi:hypothetical protein
VLGGCDAESRRRPADTFFFAANEVSAKWRASDGQIAAERQPGGRERDGSPTVDTNP